MALTGRQGNEGDMMEREYGTPRGWECTICGERGLCAPVSLRWGRVLVCEDCQASGRAWVEGAK